MTVPPERTPPGAFEAPDPGYADRIRESFGRQAMMQTLGATLGRIEPGLVEIRFDYRPELTQQNGYLHAGALAAIADSAAGYAAFSLAAADTDVLAVEFKINLVAPARGQRFLARARVVRAGRTLTTCAADVLDVSDEGEERIVATMLSTVITLRGR